MTTPRHPRPDRNDAAAALDAPDPAGDDALDDIPEAEWQEAPTGAPASPSIGRSVHDESQVPPRGEDQSDLDL